MQQSPSDILYTCFYAPMPAKRQYQFPIDMFKSFSVNEHDEAGSVCILS